jgi:hypothetical protein
MSKEAKERAMDREELIVELRKFQEEEAKRKAYSKRYRKEHPLTAEQKAKRKGYAKEYNERKKARKQAIYEAAEKLNLI